MQPVSPELSTLVDSEEMCARDEHDGREGVEEAAQDSEDDGGRRREDGLIVTVTSRAPLMISTSECGPLRPRRDGLRHHASGPAYFNLSRPCAPGKQSRRHKRRNQPSTASLTDVRPQQLIVPSITGAVLYQCVADLRSWSVLV